MVSRLSVTEVRKRMSEALALLRDSEQWVLITRYGEAVAALVSVRAVEELAARDPDSALKLEIQSPTLELERAATVPPETKTNGDGADPASEAASMPELQPDDLMRRIEAVRAEMGLGPYRS